MYLLFLFKQRTNRLQENILTEKYKGLSYVQKLLRKLIYPVCDAYLGASKKTLKLFS